MCLVIEFVYNRPILMKFGTVVAYIHILDDHTYYFLYAGTSTKCS